MLGTLLSLPNIHRIGTVAVTQEDYPTLLYKMLKRHLVWLPRTQFIDAAMKAPNAMSHYERQFPRLSYINLLLALP